MRKQKKVHGSRIEIIMQRSGVLMEVGQGVPEIALVAGCEYPNARGTNYHETQVVLFDLEAEKFLKHDAAEYMHERMRTVVNTAITLASMDKEQATEGYLRVSVSIGD